MTDIQLTVPDLSCSHCVQATGKALATVAGLSGFQADPERKRIRFQLADPALLPMALARLEAAGYPAQRD